jgi:hypothetical protein
MLTCLLKIEYIGQSIYDSQRVVMCHVVFHAKQHISNSSGSENYVSDTFSVIVDNAVMNVCPQSLFNGFT